MPRSYQKPTKNRYEHRSSLSTRSKRALGRLRASSGPSRAANLASKTTNIAAKTANLRAKMAQLGVRRPSQAVLGASVAVPCTTLIPTNRPRSLRGRFPVHFGVDFANLLCDLDAFFFALRGRCGSHCLLVEFVFFVSFLRLIVCFTSRCFDAS